jgi:adenine-specific DNA-methyltransferase
MNNKPKLELTWIGKDEQPKLEPRILIEDQEKSYGDKNTENMLIYGDNLLALKALEQDFSGKIKCIYIDPPYNTGSAFEYYDDSREHSIWLSLMRDRLIFLHKLLRDDGFIFVQIDNNEMAYLKVLMDEIFGRDNFVNDIIWKRRGGSANPNNRLNNVTDFVLWYSKSRNYSFNQIFSLDDINTKEYIEERFTNTLKGKKYMLAPIERNQKLGMRETLRYEYKGYVPEYGWMVSYDRLVELDGLDRLHWNSKGRPVRRVFLEDYQGQPISNLWTDIKVINPMSKERLDFDGQKPEFLLNRIITFATEAGDWVLDSFLGSGSTAATAHKMNRRWIGIELGNHCHSHCIPRLKKVCDGADQGGISKLMSWQGGGGFKYYYLAPSLLKQDKYGNWIIEEKYNANMLAAAMAKHNNFKYQPSEDVYWKQGQSSEKDFIYTTTQFITVEKLDQIHEEMQPDENLLICCKKFSKPCENRYENITIKKIPQMLLGKCEFGIKDEYSLNIISMPRNENEPEFVPKGPDKKKVVKEESNTPDLFEENNGEEE